MRMVSVALLLAAMLLLAGCGQKGTGTGGLTYEQACRLNGFSWITTQPMQHGISVSGNSCLGCTVDVDNHFCKSHKAAFDSYVAALSGFRDDCKSAGGSWMLMEPMKNNTVVSEKMCWGCMADDRNHICNQQELEDYELNSSE